jgi:hypothetical protein
MVASQLMSGDRFGKSPKETKTRSHNALLVTTPETQSLNDQNPQQHWHHHSVHSSTVSLRHAISFSHPVLSSPFLTADGSTPPTVNLCPSFTQTHRQMLRGLGWSVWGQQTGRHMGSVWWMLSSVTSEDQRRSTAWEQHTHWQQMVPMQT